MITLVIWSFDRAAQLDALLRSIEQFAEGIFNIGIIYNYSNTKFAKGYSRVIDKFDKLTWLIDSPTGFNYTTKYWINNSNEEYISTSTDDCVFYKKVDEKALRDALPKNDNEVFSFRLGYNTIIQNCHTGQLQPPLNAHINHGGWLSWPINFYHPHDNYGYPFGLDLHVFRRELIIPIMDEIEFNSTNQLESVLTNQYRHKVTELRSFEHSVAVNVPINTVTGVTRAGEQAPMTKELLNEKFLDGYIINLDSISKFKIEGCHCEIPLSLIKK